MRALISLIVLALIGVGAYYLMTKGADKGSEETQTDTSSSDSFSDGSYSADVTTSKVMWAGSKILVPGYTDKGILNIANGSATVSSGSITDGTFTFDMKSITAESTGRGSGESGLSNHLKSADFFDVEQFPTASFDITSVAMKESVYEVKGDLTIKGKTNPVVFEASLSQIDENTIAVKAETKLDRTLWDVRYGSDKFFDNLGNNVIDDMFVVTLDVVLTK